MTLELIADPADPRIADYREALDGHPRRRDELFLVEGRLVIRRLLDTSRFRVRSLLATPRALDDLRQVLTDRPSLTVYEASTETLRAIVGFKFHRGCLALAERGRPAAVADVVAATGPRLVLALDELADPDNVGTIFRNAAAFGAAGVLLSPGCADPLYRKAIRVSMGATLSTPFARGEWGATLSALRGAGYTLLALMPDPRAETIEAVAARPRPARLALILGAEGAGLSPEARAAADLHVRIPMAPGVDSLNVATACGIALHRLAASAVS